MMFNSFEVSRYSERSILIVFNIKSSKDSVRFLQNLRYYILNNTIEVILDITLSYNSLLIVYKNTINNFYDKKTNLTHCITLVAREKPFSFRKITLPVCYDPCFGIDIDTLATALNMSISQLITWHTKPDYVVCFLGFLPGFAYLKNLPKALHFPRHKTPRASIKKGAIGIGGNQTGIYPQNSPGGWQIIGNCPIDLYNKNYENRVLLKPTDVIKFKAVSKSKYFEIREQFLDNNYSLKVDHYAST